MTSAGRPGGPGPIRTSGRATLFVDSTKVSATRIYTTGLAIAQGFVVASVLGPDHYGILNAVSLVAFYGVLVGPGLLDVVTRELPFLLGSGDLQRADRVQKLGLSADLVWRLVVAFSVAAIGLVQTEPEFKFGLLISAMVLVTTRITDFYAALSQARSNFHLFSKANLLTSTMTAVFVFATVRWGGLYSVLLAPGLASIAGILYYRQHLRLGLTLSLNRHELKRMVAIGVPLQLLTLMVWAYRTSDRTVVAQFLNTTALGYYALAVTIVQYLQFPQNDFAQIVRPRLYAMLGKTSEPDQVWPYVGPPTVVLACLVPFVVGVVWLGGPLLISTFLPKYIGSIDVLRILTLNVYFATVLLIPHILLYSPSVNKQSQCAVLWAAAAALTFLFGYLLVRAGGNIEGVAIAMVAGQAFATVGIFAMSHRHYFKPGTRRAALYYLKLIVPLIYTCGVVTALEYVTGTASSVVAVSIRLVLFSALFLPVVVFLESETQALSFGRDWLRMRWAGAAPAATS